nr:cell division protein FtsZ [Rhizobium herbae]
MGRRAGEAMRMGVALSMIEKKPRDVSRFWGMPGTGANSSGRVVLPPPMTTQPAKATRQDVRRRTKFSCDSCTRAVSLPFCQPNLRRPDSRPLRFAFDCGSRNALPHAGAAARPRRDEMTEIKKPVISEMRPKITVIGVGGGGGNAINNMITEGLQGAEFVAANTDAQALTMSKATRLIQLGAQVTEGLGAGSLPEVGRAAAEESIDEIMDHLGGTHMCFVTAGMGGGTGTGAAPVIAQAARNAGILTVAVVTKPFSFEGKRRMQSAEEGIERLREAADTVIVIPNQNLFRIADAKTTFADAFVIADRVLYSGVGCITDLIVKEGLINLDFADVKSVMKGMGRAMMGTGEASGDGRASKAAEAAIANPLLSEVSMKGAKGVLISISGGSDMTLFEVDEAATRIREEVYEDADIVVGAIFDKSLDGVFRVSVVATGLDAQAPGASANVTADLPGQIQPRTLQ